MCIFYSTEAIVVVVRDPVIRNMNRDVTVKSVKRNHNQRIVMSSDDHRNEMNEIVADAAVIALIIAKNHQRNTRQQQINRNHRQMIAHLVQSKAMFHHPIAKATNDRAHHRVMQMVIGFFLC